MSHRLMSFMNDWDVIVVGAGNAGASTAVSAHEHGAKVLLIEKTPKKYRGGNTRLAGGIFRFPHNGGKDVHRNLIPDLNNEELENLAIPPYTKKDFHKDLMKASLDFAEPELAKLLVNNARPTIDWMTRLGINWQLPNSFIGFEGKKYYEPGIPVSAKGSGPGLVNMWFKIIKERKIQIFYDSKVTKILLNHKDGIVLRVMDFYNRIDLKAKSIVLCAGSFTANSELRAKYLGKNWGQVKIRGSRWNTGEVLMAALKIKAQPAGEWSGCHCSPIHLNAPKVEADDWQRRHSLYSWMWGLIIDGEGKRLLDEGEDLSFHAYAKIGRAIHETLGTVYQVFDSKPFKDRDNLMLERYYKPWISYFEANNIKELAKKLDANQEILKHTIEEYNGAVDDNKKFDPTRLDGKRTRNLFPQKSNWARKIDTPPFRAYPVTGGLTFTFAGLKLNSNCEVVDLYNKPIKGLYVAGEMAGNFYNNYYGGTGLTWGSVTGRIAGVNAAEYARSLT
jgi:tricarballylate dehydrogenase